MGSANIGAGVEIRGSLAQPGRTRQEKRNGSPQTRANRMIATKVSANTPRQPHLMRHASARSRKAERKQDLLAELERFRKEHRHGFVIYVNQSADEHSAQQSTAPDAA